MPELPEVETIVRDLAPRLAGRAIVSVEIVAGLVVRNPIAPAAGQSIHRVRRHGKFVVLECETGSLTIHLGMTGKLLVNANRTPYTRVVFHLDDGTLLYDDIRQFGRLQWEAAKLDALGPDALEISAAEFVAALRLRRGLIKPLLLNQRFVRGMGNIYTDEALFRAGIHPRAQAARLSKPRALALHAAMQQVLREAIEMRGSSISDYVDAEGRRGGFQNQHRVYARQGEPCLVCGTAIRRILVIQRGTHFCPRCQRR